MAAGLLIDVAQHGGTVMTDARVTEPILASATRTATGFEVKHSMAAWKARQALIGSTGSEQLIAYSLSVETVFGNLRALLGQISGLLILIQSRLQHDAPDLPDLAIARERWAETAEQISRLDVPESRIADRSRLTAAAAHIHDALKIIAEMRTARTDDGVGEASRRLNAAYRLMQRVCDHRIGLTMIDTSASCCSCGKKLM
jgi:hypothetical protein